jgi:type VI secretion system secreted protein VgrG
VVVANDKREEIFSHEEHRVERDERITVGGNTTITCTADMHPAVSQNQTWTVEGSRTITCGTSVSSSVTRDRSVSIGGNHTITVKGTDRTSSTEANLTEDIGTTLLEDAKGNVELSGYDALTLNVTGSLIETAGQGKSESTTGPRTEKISGDFTMNAGGAVATRVTESRTTTVKGPMSAWAIKDVVVVGKQGLTVETATTELKAGTKVTLKVGPTEIVFANGFIGFKASESITITSAGSNVQGHSTSSQN